MTTTTDTSARLGAGVASTPRPKVVVSTQAGDVAFARAAQIASDRGASLAWAPREELLDVGHRASLVVVGATRTAFGRLLAERVNARSRCPVLQVRGGGADRYPRVVVATDLGSALGDMVDAASFVAPGVPPIFLHVYDNPFESVLTLNGASEGAVAHYRREAAKAAQGRVRAHLARWGLADRPLLLEHGAPRFVLRHVPRGSLLVVHRGQSRLKHMIFGSVTHWALDETDCDVLVV